MNIMANNSPSSRSNKRKLIYRPYITIKGKRIYAKNHGKKAFCFWVDIEE